MRCQYCRRDLTGATWPDTRLALPLRKCWYILRRYVWYASVLGPLGLAKRSLSSLRPRDSQKKKAIRHTFARTGETPNLQPGEWVEVRSAKEIFATLDAQHKHMGLPLTREMMKFCGRRFKVYRRVNKIILEATGEMRAMRSPTVLLEGVICDGEFHGGCTRSCFCFWREAWLKRVTRHSALENSTRD